jgi:hypothetical protein
MLVGVASLVHAGPPLELRPWLEQPQVWQRDTDGPIVSLGTAGSFDDTHIFAPMVADEANHFQLWYCGATGAVQQRVFQLGLATSRDGRVFRKHQDNPVYSFGDHKHSVLTPTLLRDGDGSALRDNGKLRMWFSSTWFAGDASRHTLHEAASNDGISWSQPSPSQLENAYAPTVIKDGREIRMWYVDVERDPWVIRHASSLDGRRWRVSPQTCLVIDQPWERARLFYPTVLKIDDTYLMWYGSYWTARPNTTALGFAASRNGLKWYKHPQNPVLRPDRNRAWESHYVTSQSVMCLLDGSYRIWYASRKQPPFVNKYFAINTARWQPARTAWSDDGVPIDSNEFQTWQSQTRARLRNMLGIPDRRVPLDADRRGDVEWDGAIIEKSSHPQRRPMV